MSLNLASNLSILYHVKLKEMARKIEILYVFDQIQNFSRWRAIEKNKYVMNFKYVTEWIYYTHTYA